MKKRVVNKNKANTTGIVIRTIFQQELKKFESRIDAKIDFKLENLEREVDEKARKYRDQVLTSNDKLAKKFETVQQELGLGNLQMNLLEKAEHLKILPS